MFLDSIVQVSCSSLDWDDCLWAFNQWQGEIRLFRALRNGRGRRVDRCEQEKKTFSAYFLISGNIARSCVYRITGGRCRFFFFRNFCDANLHIYFLHPSTSTLLSSFADVYKMLRYSIRLFFPYFKKESSLVFILVGGFIDLCSRGLHTHPPAITLVIC